VGLQHDRPLRRYGCLALIVVLQQCVVHFAARATQLTLRRRAAS
jgi:hypothetical protein